MTCRHRWIRRFEEAENVLGDLCLFDVSFAVWFCPKCKLTKNVEFRAVIKEIRESAKIKNKINPRERRGDRK